MRILLVAFYREAFKKEMAENRLAGGPQEADTQGGRTWQDPAKEWDS
jgi:hypothetical protein